jgi:hypothetical protein
LRAKELNSPTERLIYQNINGTGNKAFRQHFLSKWQEVLFFWLLIVVALLLSICYNWLEKSVFGG